MVTTLRTNFYLIYFEDAAISATRELWSIKRLGLKCFDRAQYELPEMMSFFYFSCAATGLASLSATLRSTVFCGLRYFSEVIQIDVLRCKWSLEDS